MYQQKRWQFARRFWQLKNLEILFGKQNKTQKHIDTHILIYTYTHLHCGVRYVLKIKGIAWKSFIWGHSWNLTYLTFYNYAVSPTSLFLIILFGSFSSFWHWLDCNEMIRIKYNFWQIVFHGLWVLCNVLKLRLRRKYYCNATAVSGANCLCKNHKLMALMSCLSYKNDSGRMHSG